MYEVLMHKRQVLSSAFCALISHSLLSFDLLVSESRSHSRDHMGIFSGTHVRLFRRQTH